MQLKEPWVPCFPDFAARAEQELAAVVSDKHALAGIPVKAVACRQDQDDVLFELQDGSGRVAAVHLTFSGKKEKDPQWPRTELFKTYQQWLREGMERDAQEFADS